MLVFRAYSDHVLLLGLGSVGGTTAPVPRANAEPGFLDERLGSAGNHFYALSHAQDPRRVARRRVAKSVGSDRTLNKDVFRRSDICAHIRRSADRIGRRLRGKRYVANGVRVKLKTFDFKILTRQRILGEPTDVADTLYTAGESLLDEFLKVDIRIGTVIACEAFREARRPAYKLRIDFGPDIGIKKSSARITDLYAAEAVVGRQVAAVVNFAPRQIGPMMSEVLAIRY